MEQPHTSTSQTGRTSTLRDADIRLLAGMLSQSVKHFRQGLEELGITG
ncbi:MAG: hypothetical protein FWC87_01480 [Acidimicrobiaceae bacterium]|nr:hypothetical protein [Acidimicrobiaceae bacterium]